MPVEASLDLLNMGTVHGRQVLQGHRHWDRAGTAEKPPCSFPVALFPRTHVWGLCSSKEVLSDYTHKGPVCRQMLVNLGETSMERKTKTSKMVTFPTNSVPS